jgi:hypothetical protein
VVFPTDPTDLDIEMNIAGTWVNLRTGGFILDRGVSITRGRSDEAGEIEPSQLSMTLNNKDGRFSPRNPTGPYYGVIGNNTPVRASVSRGTTSMETRDSGDKATCPNASAFSITGNIDIRIDINTDSWGGTNLCGKWVKSGNNRSWLFQVGADGTLRFIWSTDGTDSAADGAISTLPIPMYPGRLALRVSLNAATAKTTFYTAPTIDGTWTQLGDTVGTILGASSATVHSSTAPLEVGGIADEPFIAGGDNRGNSHAVQGRVNAFELRNSSGTVVANPIFIGKTAGTTSFADTAGTPNTWTLAGSAAINNRHWRFHGELAALPTRWDTSGNDVYVPVEVNGILRRLRASDPPLRSAIYRSIIAETSLVEYWPCTDESSSTSIASALEGHRPMAVKGSPSFAGSSGFKASEPLPTLNKSVLTGNVSPYTPDTSGSQVRFLLDLTDTSNLPPNNTVLFRVKTSGSASQYDFIYQTADGGTITRAVYGNKDEAGDDQLVAPGTGISECNGTLLRLSVDITDNTLTTNCVFHIETVGSPGAIGLPSTIQGRRPGTVTQVVANPSGSIDGNAIGHISIHSSVSDLSDFEGHYDGFDGESAGRRMQRLCEEEGIPFRMIGNIDGTAKMGVQTPASLSDLWQGCAEADQGLLFEPRDMLGIGFRAQNSLYNQPPRLTLDYSNGAISDALEPTDDDQKLQNDVTVTRAGGSSARVQQSEGRLSVNPYPNGAGRYDSSVTVNVAYDNQLPDQAAWRVKLGTVDEARYPTIGADFAGPAFVGNDAMNEAMLSVELGDRIVVQKLPDFLPPDDVSQLAQGYTETFGNHVHRISFNTSPESPYHAPILTSSRVDTSGSELASDVSGTATTLSVSTTSGAIWTTSSAFLPMKIMVGGELMTVTAISGSSSPQTFTVSRSVNGVVKPQTAGTPVNIADQTFVAIGEYVW